MIVVFGFLSSIFGYGALGCLCRSWISEWCFLTAWCYLLDFLSQPIVPSSQSAVLSQLFGGVRGPFTKIWPLAPTYHVPTSTYRSASSNRSASSCTQSQDFIISTTISAANPVNFTVSVSSCWSTPIYQYFAPMPPLLSAATALFCCWGPWFRDCVL